MANQKPKKSGKKPVSQPATKKETTEVKETVTTTTATTIASACEHPMKGFFARKYDKDENILTIFKTPRIWGALIGEVIGTMLFVMLMLTLGAQPLYLLFAATCIYVAVVGLSGANLNPIVTVGMMASRRMSAIRGVLYMLAQLLGGWVALIIINAFRLGSGTSLPLPEMTEISGESFWAVALVELMGAIIIAFCYARATRYTRKNPLTFALTVTSGITLAVILALVITQSFYGYSDSFIFNPIAALMYQILPTTAENFGELAQMAGLAVAAYIIFPVIGGVIGFYISDVATRLSCGGYFCECDSECDRKEVCKK
jgi:glycerol uptake facilitator-like aquaporin